MNKFSLEHIPLILIVMVFVIDKVVSGLKQRGVDLPKFPAITIIDINRCVAIIIDLPDSSYFTINSMRAGIVDDSQDMICLDDKLYNQYAHLFPKFLGFSWNDCDDYIEKGWICLRNLN